MGSWIEVFYNRLNLPNFLECILQSSQHDCEGVFGHFMAKYEILLIDDNCFPLFFLAFTSGHLGAVRTQYPIQYNREEREIPLSH